jgi:hypothetical protein
MNDIALAVEISIQQCSPPLTKKEEEEVRPRLQEVLFALVNPTFKELEQCH